MFSKKATAKTVVPAFLLGELFGVASSYSEELFGISFSTHLVVPGGWSVTIVISHILSTVLRTQATAEQQRLMWAQVVRGDASDS